MVLYAGRLKDEGSKCGWKGSMKNATGSSLGVVILFGSLGAMQKVFFIIIIIFFLLLHSSHNFMVFYQLRSSQAVKWLSECNYSPFYKSNLLLIE